MKYFTFIVFNIILISGAKAQFYPMENYLEKKFQIIEVNSRRAVYWPVIGKLASEYLT